MDREALIAALDVLGGESGDVRVDAYGPTWLTVNNVRIDGAVLIGNRFVVGARVAAPGDLTRDDIELVRVLRPLPGTSLLLLLAVLRTLTHCARARAGERSTHAELLLVGTGHRTVPLAPAVRAYVRSLGVPMDVLTTVRTRRTRRTRCTRGHAVRGARTSHPHSAPVQPRGRVVRLGTRGRHVQRAGAGRALGLRAAVPAGRCRPPLVASTRLRVRARHTHTHTQPCSLPRPVV